MLQLKLFPLLFVCLTLATASSSDEPKFLVDQNGDESFWKSNNTETDETYPVYQIIEPMKPFSNIFTSMEVPTTAATAAETIIAATTTEDFRNVDVILDDDLFIVDDGADDMILDDELPGDLLDIIHSKLGFKKFYKTPTTSEFGEFLGISNASDIIQRIRELMNTEEGVAKIKAYIVSSDDNNTYNFQKQFKVKDPLSNYEIENQSIVGQIGECMNARNALLAKYKKDVKRKHKKQTAKLKEFKRFTVNEKQKALEDIEHAVIRAVIDDILKNVPESTPKTEPLTLVETISSQITPQKRPSYMLHPLPFNYPVPLRSIGTAGKQQKQQQQQPHASLPITSHLNTPKEFTTPIELQRVANMSPKKIQAILQSKPKLAALVSKIRSIPLTRETAALINAPLLAAVQRALKEDEDLKKLLTSTETLK